MVNGVSWMSVSRSHEKKDFLERNSDGEVTIFVSDVGSFRLE
jgi:hypothetical protein